MHRRGLGCQSIPSRKRRSQPHRRFQKKSALGTGVTALRAGRAGAGGARPWREVAAVLLGLPGAVPGQGGRGHGAETCVGAPSMCRDAVWGCRCQTSSHRQVSSWLPRPGFNPACATNACWRCQCCAASQRRGGCPCGSVQGLGRGASARVPVPVPACPVVVQLDQPSAFLIKCFKNTDPYCITT